MTNTVLTFKNSLCEHLENFTQKPNWKLKFSGLCFLIIIFFSFPPLEQLSNTGEGSTWHVVLKQIEHPLSPIDISDDATHNAKRTFRLFVPVLCKVLMIHNVYLIYTLQLLVAFSFFFLVIQLTERILKDKVSAMLLALSFCFVYAGQVGILDTTAKFDSIAITCLLAALYFRNPILIFFFCFAAAWIDERGLIATPMVFLWWKIQEIDLEKFNFKNFLRPKLKSSIVLVAILSYLILRKYISEKYNLTTANGGVGLKVLFNEFNMISFGLWSVFEGLWVLIFLAFTTLIDRKKFTLIILFSLSLAVSITVSFLVLDITRSMIYCLPALFIALYLITINSRINNVKNILVFCFLVSAIVPTYFAEGAFRIEGSNPLVLKLLNFSIHQFIL